MTTKNPRIHVTLKPSTAALLKRMSALTKNSQSAIIGELLEESEPVFERMVKVIEAAQEAQVIVKTRVRENLEAAQGVLDRQLGLMLGDLEVRTRDAVDGLEAIHRRKVSGGADTRSVAAPTPLSNRGVVNPGGQRPGKAKRGRRRHGR
jgi:hypothetical protein